MTLPPARVVSVSFLYIIPWSGNRHSRAANHWQRDGPEVKGLITPEYSLRGTSLFYYLLNIYFNLHFELKLGLEVVGNA